MNLLQRAEWRLYKDNKRRKLKNINPTVLSSNCNGSFIMHDLGLKFNTPTINLYFTAKDYLSFVSNLDRYLKSELTESDENMEFPVGRLADISLYFMHYKSFDEARKKWNERKKRINKNNLFLMMTDKNGCTYEDIELFDHLPFENKVVFTHKPYPEIKSAFYIKGFENDGEVGILSDFKPGFFRRRYLDDFDYVGFLNRGMNNE